MANKKKKAIPKTEKTKGSVKEKLKSSEEAVVDDFDFGGFPKDVNLKKNIGCGG